MLQDALHLARAAVEHPLQVATLFPTSAALGRRLAATVDPGGRGAVVELGPGSGAITRHLATRVGDPDRYVGLEVSADLIGVLRARHPELRFHRGRARLLGRLLADGEADSVIASLPWTILPSEERDASVEAVARALRSGGTLATFICLHAVGFHGARALLGQLRAWFREVRPTFLEWRNLPPAVVYEATR